MIQSFLARVVTTSFKWFKEQGLLLVSILISCITFRNFLSFDIFTSSDWYYYFPQTLREYLNINIWIDRTNLGMSDSTIWRTPFYFLVGLFNRFGLGYNVSEKVLVFWPVIFLAPVAGYYLCKEFKSNNSGAFIGSLVFSFNTYFLAIITQGHILLNVAFVIGTFGLIFYIQAIKSSNFKRAIIASLLSAICGYLDFRSLYILVIIVGIYGLSHFRKSWDFIKVHLAFGLSLIAVNIFWLVPFMVNKGGIGSDVLDRGLFGNKFWSFRAATALFHPFWSGGKIEWFIIQNLYWYFWILPIIVFLGSLCIIYARQYRTLFFLSLTTIVGIMLTKQVDAPFPQLYQWLFDYFPGFKAFREATKFYFFIIVGYTVLSSLFITFLSKSKLRDPLKGILEIIALVLLTCALCVNTIPYTFNQVAGLIDRREIPQVYKDFNKQIESESVYSRTLWVPRESRWAINTTTHPKINFVELLSKNFRDLEKVNNYKDADYSYPKQILKFFNFNFFPDYLNNIGVKYIVVPLQDFNNFDDFYNYYGKDRNAYINGLDSVPYLKKSKLSNDDLTIYENTNWQYSSYTHTGSTVAIDNLTNLESKYNFIANTLGYNRPQIFNASDKDNINTSQSNITSITDPYSQITLDNVNLETNTISTNVDKKNYEQAYINKSQRRINYELKNTRLTLYLEDSRGAFYMKELLDDATTILKTINVDPKRDYYINYNDQYTQLKPGHDTIGIYQEKSPLVIYSTDNQNPVQHSGFEDGFWQQKVGDCFNYDEKADINMTLNDYGASGQHSLKLSSKNHIACTQQNIPVEKGQDYLFRLKYRLEKPNSVAGYNISLMDYNDNDDQKNLKESIEDSSHDWNKYSRFITNPKDNSRLELTLYADGTPEGNEVSYDDVSIIKMTNELTFELPSVKPDFQKITINQDNDFTYAPFFQMKNLIQNGTFDTNLWKDKVGDCSNHDNDAQIAMERIQKDNPYLELRAGNHIACTSQAQALDKNVQQLVVSMKYKTTGLQLGYYLSFNDINNTIYKDYQNFKTPVTDWTRLDKVINVPNGATKVILGLYGLPNNRTMTATDFDDISMIGIPRIDNSVYMTRNTTENPESQYHPLEFDTQSSDLKIKNKYTYTENSQIVLNTQYDTYWKAYLNDKQIPDEFHYKVQNYTNVWLLDKDKLCQKMQLCLQTGGVVNLRIEYQASPYFKYGLIFSSFIFLGCCMYLIKPTRKQKIHKVINRSFKSGEIS